jgi:N-sulfoglucosamine sulfohydrolase
MVSTLDFTPTLLDALGLPAIPDVDGRSFLPALRGEGMAGWDRVFTEYNAAFGNAWLPMRCIRTKTRAYIWNAWCDGRKRYQTENMAGLTWKAMLAAAEHDAAIRARTDFYAHRVPEEFYDLSTDRFERTNLIASPAHQAEVEALRAELLSMMRRTDDPFAEAFADRGDRRLVAETVEAMARDCAERRR